MSMYILEADKDNPTRLPETQAFVDAGLALDFYSLESLVGLVNITDHYSSVLAKDENFRRVLGQNNLSLWPTLHNLWKITSDAHYSDIGLKIDLKTLCLSLAKFTRNLVASNPENQQASFESEPAMRRLIHHYTSFAVMKEASSFPVTRMLVQMLSNMITSNESLINRIWDLYLSLPEEQSILTRLIPSPDALTVSATLIFVINCLHGSDDRTKSLTIDTNGVRLSKSIVHRMAMSFDAEDASDEDPVFDLSYTLLSTLIREGRFPTLFEHMAMEEEPVTPNQTVLLKVLDSYLQTPEAFGHQDPQKTEIVRFLTSTFFSLTARARNSMQRALGLENINDLKPDLSSEPLSHPASAKSVSDPEGDGDPELSTPQELDLLLPQMCETVVLITQCLISILLSEETGRSPDGSSTNRGIENCPTKGYLVTATNSPGFVESLIDTLRLIDTFLPRVTFGKVLPRPRPFQDSVDMSNASVPKQTASTPVPPGFQYVKRDLTRLLGILCADDKAVQDRVRLCGGIPVIMNLCVVDDNNPYLREHAIFTLRNLLHGNLENQAVVDAVKPVARWDEYGVLQNV